MADIVKVSWSGGKDSSCAVMLHLERGHKVKAVCYIPMFTETIPLLLTKNIEIIAIIVGYLPLQGIKLLVTIAKILSLLDSIILQPVTPTALQPTPIHIVSTCLPQYIYHYFY